jgi:hypothetical protein
MDPIFAPSEIPNSPKDAEPSRTLVINLQSIDAVNIVNAWVILNETAIVDSYQIKQSDINGNVTFTNLENSNTYRITVLFTAGIPAYNFTIKDQMFELNIAESGTAYLSLECDLTTVDLTLRNAAIFEEQYWGLNNANLTLINGTTDEKITSFFTDGTGCTRLMIPAGEYKIEIAYLGIARQFFIHESLDHIPEIIKSLTVVNQNAYYLNVTVNEEKTELVPLDVVYTQPDWTHNQEITTSPYQIEIYYRASFNLKIQWRKYGSNSPIVNPTAPTIWNRWTIERQGEILNSSLIASDALQPVSGEDGNYSIFLNSTEYAAGLIQFILWCNATGLQDAQLVVSIIINNNTASLTQVSPESTIEVIHGNQIDVIVNYTSVLPTVLNLTEAIVQYSVIDQDYSGSMIRIMDGTGLYSFSRSASLNVGTYSLEIIAWQNNYNVAELNIVLIVLDIPTNLSVNILNASNRVESNYLKTAYGENITFAINFTNFATGVGVTTSNLNVSFNGILQGSSFLNEKYPGYWIFNRSSSSFSTGIYNVLIEIAKPNYESQSLYLTVEIIETWKTQLLIIEPPLIYYWGDNATFVVRLVATENPRANNPLPGAQIPDLTIITKSGGVDIIQRVFTITTLNNQWGWSDLQNDGNYGFGFYRIWFMTSMLNLTTQTTFFAIPRLTLPLYQQTNTEVNFWVNPRPITLQITEIDNPNLPITTCVLQQNDDATLQANLTLSVIGRSSDRQPVNGQPLIYTLWNHTDSSILGTGSFTFTTSGLYIYPIDTSAIGAYRLEIIAQIQNHTMTPFIFYFNVTAEVDYFLTFPAMNMINPTTFRAAHGENVTFWINNTDSNPGAVEFSVFIGDDPNPVMNLFPVDANNYTFTIPASGYAVATYQIRVIGTKSEFESTTRSFALQIVTSWASRTELVVEPESLPWGSNVSFIISYVGNELIRTGVPIAGATISRLYLYTSTEFFGLTENDRDILWGTMNYTEYGSEFYLIWFNSSLFTLLQNQLIISAEVEVNCSGWSNGRLAIPILITGVNTALYIHSDRGGSDFSVLKIKYMDSDNFTAIYNVTEQDFFGYGTNLTDGAVFLRIFYPNGTYLNQWQFTVSSSGKFNLTFSTISLNSGEYMVQIVASKNNYISRSRSFTLIIGLDNTPYTVTLDPLQQVGAFSIKVSRYELTNITILIPGATGNAQELNATINGNNIGGIQFIQNGIYRIQANLSQYSIGIHVIVITVWKLNYLPVEIPVTVELIETWTTQLQLIEPPLLYSWGNRIIYNLTYSCIESPRQSVILSGASISSLEIIQLIEGTQISMLNLSGDTIGTIWGWSEMTPIAGKARYSIWFDTHFVSVNTTSSFYLIPTVSKLGYNSPNISPYSWIKLVATELNLVQKFSGDLLTLYLGQTQPIEVNFIVTDRTSVYYDSILPNATIRVRIYDKSTLSMVQDITMTRKEANRYTFTLIPPNIGNFTVELTATLANFQTGELIFTLIVPQKEIIPVFQSTVKNMVINAPINLPCEIILRPTDPITQEPIINANVSVIFLGTVYQLIEDSQSPGTYRLVLPASLLQTLNSEQSYDLSLIIEKENYKTLESTLQVYIGIPVDPYLKVPYRYWTIVGSALGIGVVGTVAYKAIQYSRIPATVKRINTMMKIIRKKKSLGEGSPVPPRQAELLKEYGASWNELELDMNSFFNLEDQGGQ